MRSADLWIVAMVDSRHERPRYPRGSWLRSELCCLGPSRLTPTPSASLVGTRRLHDLVAYTPRLRCAGAPRRPARPSLLSLLCCPHAPPTLHRWVPVAVPLCFAHRVPGSLGLSSSRHPQRPSLPAILDGVIHFGAASFASCCGPHVCPALRAGYDEMQPYVLHLTF